MSARVTHRKVTSGAVNPTVEVDLAAWNDEHVVEGLDKVDNTSDLEKPISAATQAALTSLSTALSTLAASVSNVNNTSDLNKPISTATQAALTALSSSLSALAASISNVDNTSDLNKPISTATAAALGSLSALKANYIVNGAMMVSQENGATVGTASSYYPIDQFHVNFSNGGAVSIAQVASATPAGSPNRLRVSVTTADAAVAAGDFAVIIQEIEGLRAAGLLFGTAAAKTITVQFGVKAPAGTYCVVVLNSVTNRSYVAQYTIAAGEANTDVVKSVTIPGDTSGTWLKDTGVGLIVRWSLMAGSTFQQASGAWSTGNAIGSPSQFNLMGTLGNVFELFDVGFYEGATAPAFQVPDYGRELRDCQRYFWKWSPVGNNTIAAQIHAYSASGVWGKLFDLPVDMRVAPTVSVSSASHFMGRNSAGSATTAFATMAFSTMSTTKNIVMNDATGSSGMTAGDCVPLAVNTASAWIAASARL